MTEKKGSYLGGILGLIAADKITTNFVQNHVTPNLVYGIIIIP
jgi:hypothetical protein